MNEREAAVQIARITASVASGELAEEAGQQAINEIRRQLGLEDNVVLDVAQAAASYSLGVGSVAADATEVVVDSLFDLFD